MNATNRPLHLLEAHAYLSGTLTAISGIPSEFWLITQGGLNFDLAGHISQEFGLHQLSVAGFGKYLIQIYQKAQELVRAEVHTWEDIPLDALLGYVRRCFTALDEIRREEVR